ncbi:MAG TPA: sulfate permease [Lacisediminihabitans sp.]
MSAVETGDPAMIFFIPPSAFRAAASLYWLSQRWMPTNILVRRVRTRHGLRWGIPLALLGLLYAVGAVVCATLAQHGASGWWNLGFLLGLWNALKLVGNGLYATAGLLVVRVRESGQRRHATAVH